MHKEVDKRLGHVELRRVLLRVVVGVNIVDHVGVGSVPSTARVVDGAAGLL